MIEAASARGRGTSTAGGGEQSLEFSIEARVGPKPILASGLKRPASRERILNTAADIQLERRPTLAAGAQQRQGYLLCNKHKRVQVELHYLAYNSD